MSVLTSITTTVIIAPKKTKKTGKIHKSIRIISAGNIVISCARCNFAKASLSYGLFTRLISCLKSTDPQLLEDFLEECFEARSRRPFMEQGVRQQAAKDDMFMAGGIDWF